MLDRNLTNLSKSRGLAVVDSQMGIGELFSVAILIFNGGHNYNLIERLLPEASISQVAPKRMLLRSENKI